MSIDKDQTTESEQDDDNDVAGHKNLGVAGDDAGGHLEPHVDDTDDTDDTEDDVIGHKKQ